MKNINSSKQIFFDFGRDYDAQIDNFFFTKKNEVLSSQIKELINNNLSDNIFISGEQGSGKTFLLNSVLNEIQSKEKISLYIDVSKLKAENNNFEGLESSFLLCLDNVDKCEKDIQIQIFNLINECKNTETILLLTSNYGINEINVFADLQSRIAQMNGFYINELEDTDVKGAIKFISKKLNINLDDDSVNYLELFIRRDFFSIKQMLSDLDRYIYSEKKQPSKMMVAKFIKQLGS